MRAAIKLVNFASSSSELACVAALLEDDLALRVEKRNDRGMVEAALAVGAIADAERRGEFAHRVVVGR